MQSMVDRIPQPLGSTVSNESLTILKTEEMYPLALSERHFLCTSIFGTLTLRKAEHCVTDKVIATQRCSIHFL
jgi:hypothetical protein